MLESKKKNLSAMKNSNISRLNVKRVRKGHKMLFYEWENFRQDLEHKVRISSFSGREPKPLIKGASAKENIKNKRSQTCY